MAQGRAFEFQAQEQRDVSKLNRLYGQADQARGAAAAARQSETSAIMGGINALGGAIGSGAFGGLGGGAASAATSGGGTGLGGSFGGASGTGQFSSQVSQFTPSSSGSYSMGQYGTNVSSFF